MKRFTPQSAMLVTRSLNGGELTLWLKRRAGTSLSEVLISLLVMSVGVVSLATLFPIAVLRSVQATHLTNATNLRYNVEALLSVRPQLYTVGTPWVAAGSYAVGDLVTPTELSSLKLPAVVFQCTTAGTSGTQEPGWDLINGNSTNDGSVVWSTYLLQNYVIDPLGKWNVESAFRSTATNGDFFGNYGGAPRAIQLPTGAYNVRAFPGLGASNLYMASEIATLPDSWITQGESNAVTGVTGTTCTLTDMQVDIAQTLPIDPTGTFPQSRIILFDGTGKFSEVRPISACGPLTGANVTVTWPAFSGPLSISPVQARVESKEQRYSWLLSVRRGFSGTSFMDVVVFFRRSYSAKDEQVYPATFTASTDPGFDGQPGVQGVDDDGDGTTDNSRELGWPGSDDSSRNWVVVQYDDAAGDKPYLKKGGFVTDADGLRWYRIIDITEGDLINGYTPAAVMTKAGLNTTNIVPDGVPTAFTTPKAIFLRVENKILQSGPQPSAPGGQPTGGAILMKGIIDVYPIRTRLTWED
jgi:Tfp pilus assembly protein PilV